MHGGFVQEGSGDPLCLAGRRTKAQKHVNVVVGAANLIGSPHTLRANTYHVIRLPDLLDLSHEVDEKHRL